MKWVYLLALIIVTPALTFTLRATPRYLVHACFALGVSMFVLAPSLWVTPVSWPGWPAPVQGIEVSFIDAISIALIFSTPSVASPRSMKLAMGVLFLAIFASSF